MPDIPKSVILGSIFTIIGVLFLVEGMRINHYGTIGDGIGLIFGGQIFYWGILILYKREKKEKGYLLEQK